MKRPDLGISCDVKRLSYDFDKQAGKFETASGHCNMDNCIALFEQIDPKAKTIQTFVGGEPDTVYKRPRNGEWAAYATKP